MTAKFNIKYFFKPHNRRLYSSCYNHVQLTASSGSGPRTSSLPQKSYYLNSRNLSAGNSLNMRFVQFTKSPSGPQQLGVQNTNDGDIIEVGGVDPSIPNGLVELLRGGPKLMDKAKKVIAEGKSTIPLKDVCILPPLTSPDKVICVGLNYSGHCEEQNVKFPKEPMFFSKFSSCIVGAEDDVEKPKVTTMLDWEVELAIVIGMKGKDIRVEDAYNHVFGYTLAQDISARDWQKNRNGRQWLLGKSMDKFCPLGPGVVTKDSISDPHDLRIRCKVNGVSKQDANTSELIHRIDHIISFLSQTMTLLPGDVILTGTPSGVGMFRDPPEYLEVGDVIESEIDCIGKMRNKIV